MAKLNALRHRRRAVPKSPSCWPIATRYNGVLDENMGRAADQAIGMIGSVFGSKNRHRDDDWEYTITFGS